jgi:histidine ammonia-lyase
VVEACFRGPAYGLQQLLTRGERIYGVNTGAGGTIKFALQVEHAERPQQNIRRRSGGGSPGDRGMHPPG